MPIKTAANFLSKKKKYLKIVIDHLKPSFLLIFVFIFRIYIGKKKVRKIFSNFFNEGCFKKNLE